jgi:hypothetical protein
MNGLDLIRLYFFKKNAVEDGYDVWIIFKMKLGVAAKYVCIVIQLICLSKAVNTVNDIEPTYAVVFIQLD